MKVIRLSSAAILLLSGIVLPEVIGAAQPGYDPITMYLSELGAVGAASAGFTNAIIFPVTGLAVLIMLWLAHQRIPKHGLVSLGLIVCIGVSAGYLGPIAFPCEPGCPLAGGGLRQTIHNGLGLMEYGGAIAGLALISVGLYARKALGMMAASLLAAGLVVAGFAMMLASYPTGPYGFWQRVADYGFFVWLVLMVTAPRTMSRKAD